MIKQFSAGDITIRPFRTFKNWTVQSIDSSSLDSYGYSTYYKNFCEINEGKKLNTTFYPSGSPYFNSVSESINSSGKYFRNVYSMTDAMFYRYKLGQYELFGVEKYGEDNATGRREVRNIHNRIVTLALNQSVYGEKIKPYSVKIVDNSNVNSTYEIFDDGCTNLYITGSHFSDYTKLGGVKNLPPKPFYYSGSIQYYVTSSTGERTNLTLSQAESYKNMGVNVLYDENTVTWSFDESYARNYFQPENEHFGESVSTWYKYVAVGSSMDRYSLSTARQGYAAIFKYDDSVGYHRLVKKFYSPFTQNGMAIEFGIDNSILFGLENNNFLSQELFIASASYLEDSFGYSVCVRDNFLAVGCPSGSICEPTSSYPGFVYVYDKNKGGTDNWGLINILQGASNADKFGNSVSLDGDIMAVGAPGVSGSGAVYVFRKKQYMSSGCNDAPTSSFWQTISPAYALCETGSYLTTPAPMFISGNYSWIYEATITSSVITVGDNFGWCVSTDSGSIMVGTNKTGKGYASFFTCSYYSSSAGACPTASWSEYSIVRADASYGDLDMGSPLYKNDITSTTITTDKFGTSVALSGPNAVVGCRYDKAFVPYPSYSGSPSIFGAAYFFKNKFLCGEFGFYRIFKSFGERKYLYNNNFGNAVSIEGNIAVVSSLSDKLGRTVDYISGSFILEDYNYESTSSEDINGVLGRVVVFNYDDLTENWKITGNVKHNKSPYCPTNIYGYSTSVSSDFLAVGAPIVNFAGADTSSIFDHNIQVSSSFPANYSGSVFVYDLNKYEESPLIGNVFYKNGYVVLTSTASNYYNIISKTGSRGFEMDFQGSHTIFEHEYLVSIKPGEFNYSTNPSSIAQQTLLFDVNQDGVFDFMDVDLIMRYLQKKKFFEEFVFDDNGMVLEQDTLKDYSWWNSDILQTESEDVLMFESEQAAYFSSSSFNAFTKTAFDYIETKLVATGILDVDGNGNININDGYIISLYYLNKLDSESLEELIDENSTRRYVKDIRTYLNQYCKYDPYKVNPEFLSYQYSSSFDPTGSYLAPFITTVGLYDTNNQLVAVGKMGRPLKNMVDWPVNIVVRFDT